MLFNSPEFIFVFLPIALVGYFFLNKKRLVIAAKVWLVSCSLFFYSWWNPIYLMLILASLFFNYAFGTILSNRESSLNILVALGISISANLLLLGYFKYADFFILNLNFVVGSSFLLLKIILPLAISFFTFQQIAYLVDSYRGITKEYDFLNYALFVTFFPQLIAGPIVHHKEMMPQFKKNWNKLLNFKNLTVGLYLFSIGLLKKMVIADTFAQWSTAGFDQTSVLNFIEGWCTSLSYTFQLYFDFSGYTDMALGAALMFNIRLPENFNSPYKAKNIQDFWRRWHITLSRFLRDYVYIPLGGNQKGGLRTCINILITFLLGGLWHGASWTFVFWGGLHGIAIVIFLVWKAYGFKLKSFWSWLITFNFVNIAWVFFRATNINDALKVLRGMFGFEGMNVSRHLVKSLPILQEWGFTVGKPLANMQIEEDVFRWIIGGFIVIFLKNSLWHRDQFKPDWLRVFIVAAMWSAIIMNANKVSEFLYFNF